MARRGHPQPSDVWLPVMKIFNINFWISSIQDYCQIKLSNIKKENRKQWILGSGSKQSSPESNPQLCSEQIKVKNFSRKNLTVIFMTVKCQQFYIHFSFNILLCIKQQSLGAGSASTFLFVIRMIWEICFWKSKAI